MMRSEVMQQHVASYMKGLYEPKYAEITAYSEKEKVPSVSPLTGELLNLLVKIQQPKVVLELGCGIGMSTSYLLDSGVEQLDAVDLNEARLERAAEFLSGDDRVSFYHSHVEKYLDDCSTCYDLVFVDTVKKDYLSVWYKLRPVLNTGALVIFDDVLLYGYVANQTCEIPAKYRNGVNELKNFINEITSDPAVSSYVLPVTDGILVVRYDG